MLLHTESHLEPTVISLKLSWAHLVFIVLNLTQECITERIMARHGECAEGAEGLERAYSAFQPADEDEERAYNVTIQKGMSKQEVLQEVLKIVDRI